MVLRLPSLRMPSSPSLPTADPAPSDRCTSLAAGACLRGFRQRLRRHQHGGFDVSRSRRPGQLANGEPEPIGRRQNHGLAGYLDTNSGQHRQRVIPACGHCDLADRLGEQLGGHDSRLIGQGRQRRVVLDRHGRQGEFRAAAVQQHPGAFHADIHRFGRKRPCDIRQQPPGHQNASRRSYLGCNLYFGRNLVVESRDGQAILGTGQQARRRAPEPSAWSAGCGPPRPPRRRSLRARAGTSNRRDQPSLSPRP